MLSSAIWPISGDSLGDSKLPPDEMLIAAGEKKTHNAAIEQQESYAD